MGPYKWSPRNKTKQVDFRLMISLESIFKPSRFGQDANGGKSKISTILCLYRFKYWDYTQSLEHRKLDCLETLTRGSYCSATQQNKPFQFPISYLVFAMIVPLGFKNLRSGLMPRTSFIFPSWIIDIIIELEFTRWSGMAYIYGWFPRHIPNLTMIIKGHSEIMQGKDITKNTACFGISIK